MKRNSLPSSLLIGILSVFVVFFLPFGVHIDLGPGPNSLISMVWEIPFESAWYSIRFFSALRFYSEYCLFRLVFLFEIFLFFIGKYSKKRIFFIGLIGESIPLLLSIPAMFILNSQGENLEPIIFPLPILLIFDLALIFFINRFDLNPSKN
ncbi:MAG: hypothetical protein ACFFAJ_10090 [Candidatus Hodarchaeota archaeon]